MYVGYVLDKDSPVYPGAARPASLSLGPQAYGPPPPPPGPPQYPDFTGYSHVEPGPVPPAAWSAPFSAPKDEWAAAYGPGPTAPTASPAPLAFGPPPDFGAVPTPPGPGPGLLAQPLGGPGTPSSPGAQRRTPYEWMRRSVAAGGGGGSGSHMWLVAVIWDGAGKFLSRVPSTVIHSRCAPYSPLRIFWPLLNLQSSSFWLCIIIFFPLLLLFLSLLSPLLPSPLSFSLLSQIAFINTLLNTRSHLLSTASMSEGGMPVLISQMSNGIQKRSVTCLGSHC
uniref:Caudal type homeobox 1 n=1 Tax=Ovis aries TaxID=9940 RepID=A0AC11DEG1_SHEEP